MVTNIKLNDDKYIATFEICDNNEDYSICSLGQKLTNDVIQVNKTFIDIDIYKSQMQEQDQRIAELEQELAEKDKLLKCYQEEEKLIADILGDKDLTIIGSRVHLKNLIVELKNKIKDKDIVIEEKDKEIERLKVFEKAYYFNQTQVSQESMDLLLQNAYQVHNETQLAIQELEKVKNFVDGRTYCADYINKRIQDLKGE